MKREEMKKGGKRGGELKNRGEGAKREGVIRERQSEEREREWV